jgi:hypothetical protein
LELSTVDSQGIPKTLRALRHALPKQNFEIIEKTVPMMASWIEAERSPSGTNQIEVKFIPTY